MEKLEDFFKYRVSFERDEYYIKNFHSKIFHTPEEYSLDF